MDCQTTRRYLALYLDSELGPETTFEIASHLEECESCRRAARQEARLEEHLRTLLVRPHPIDHAVWSRAIARIGRQPRRSKRAFAVAGFTLAAAMVILALLGTPWTADELDLAAATAAEHARALTTDVSAAGDFRKADELDSYFRRELSPAYCLGIDTAGGMRLIEAGICKLANVRAAHVVCADSQAIVSMFWLPSEAIAAFPETIKRFQKYGPSFHCHVEPFEFFVKKSGEGIVVGVARTTPALIERYVGRAAMGSCLGGA